MIISALRISNFKNYTGLNSFDLSVTDEKNVILIGGMNGSGKTTLSEAIRLCLYGHKVFGTPMSDSKYSEYINEMWSKGHKSQAMYIEMDITIDDSDNPMELTVKREFSHSSRSDDKFTENISLMRDGKAVELIDRNYWEFYIQNMIPPQISRYFFFDGERIRDTIASDGASDYLRTAIRDVSGITKMDALSNDLREVRKRLLHNDIKPAAKKRITALESTLRETTDKLEEAKEEHGNLIRSLEETQKQLEDLYSEYNRAIGIKRDEEENLRKELQTTDDAFNEISEKVSDFAYSGLIRVIMRSKIESALDAARAEDDANVASAASEYIKNRLPELRNDLKNMGFDDGQSETLCDWLSNSFFSSKGTSKNHAVVDLTYSQINSIRSQLDVGEDKYAFVKHVTERENLNIKKKKLEKELLRINDDEDLDLKSAVELKTSELEGIKESVQKSNGKISALEESCNDLRNKISEEEKRLVLSERDQQSVETIDSVISNLQDRSEMQSNICLNDFEIVLNEIYSKLKNKDDMVKHIWIGKDYSLRLEGYDGSEVDIKWISEGEKGILMYSIMYGLVTLSKSRLPLIIDSPLGRMDSEHVSHLITELYPHIGNQVIILSHDREITKDILPTIAPVISHTYLLSRKTPKVSEGYFK